MAAVYSIMHEHRYQVMFCHISCLACRTASRGRNRRHHSSNEAFGLKAWWWNTVQINYMIFVYFSSYPGLWSSLRSLSLSGRWSKPDSREVKESWFYMFTVNLCGIDTVSHMYFKSDTCCIVSLSVASMGERECMVKFLETVKGVHRYDQERFRCSLGVSQICTYYGDSL